MVEFKKEQAALERATAALNARVDEAFPVGQRVYYVDDRGRRRTYGTVAHESWNGCVAVRTASGKVHRKHYTYVFKA